MFEIFEVTYGQNGGKWFACIECASKRIPDL